MFLHLPHGKGVSFSRFVQISRNRKGKLSKATQLRLQDTHCFSRALCALNLVTFALLTGYVLLIPRTQVPLLTRGFYCLTTFAGIRPIGVPPTPLVQRDFQLLSHWSVYVLSHIVWVGVPPMVSAGQFWLRQTRAQKSQNTTSQKGVVGGRGIPSPCPSSTMLNK